MKRIQLTESELIFLVESIVNEEEGTEGAGAETGTSDAGGTGAETWSTGLVRGLANPAEGIKKWEDGYSQTSYKDTKKGPANNWMSLSEEEDYEDYEMVNYDIDSDAFKVADKEIKSDLNVPSFDEMKRKHSLPYDTEFGIDLLNESKWYNTFLDFVGIVDPTGIADGINAVSYFRQGDYLYAILSLISLVPYVGDAIAKPFIGLMKAGKINTKVINAGLKSGNSAKVAAEMGKTKAGKAVLDTMKNPTTQGFLSKILGKIGKLPGFSSFTKDAKTYVRIFTQASKQTGKVKIFRKSGGLLTRMQRKGLLNRTKLYSKFIGYLTGGGIGAAAIQGMDENSLNEKFTEFLNSDKGMDAFKSMDKEDQEEFIDALK